MKWVRGLVLSGVLALAGLPAFADATLTQLVDRLRLTEMVQALRDEGVEYAMGLNDEMLSGQGGAFYDAQVSQLYDGTRMLETLIAGLEAGLEPGQMAEALNFFDSATGAEIVSLETAARIAIQDDAVEEAARAAFAAISDGDDPRLDLIRAFAQEGDLLDRNVAGALTANYQFYLGLSDGNALDLSEDEMLAQVWEQEGAIREDTESWLFGYLFMAYQPLPVRAIEDYVAFSRSPAGIALNAALFDGYNAMFRDISYGLGRAVALSSSATKL